MQFATHIFYAVVGTVSTGAAIYAAMTGAPAAAAIAGALAFLAIYPQKPH